MCTEDVIAGALTAGVEHLRAERFAQAVPLLNKALEALRESSDLDDFTARTASLLAQAHLKNGSPAAARTAAHVALRILRRNQDEEGLQEVRALDQEIGAALASQKRQIQAIANAESAREISIDAIETAAGSPLARADALLKHANALRLLDLDARARDAAERAKHWADQCPGPREAVLARIVLAELMVAPAVQLKEAYERAAAANETTLVGLVAKTAELSGVSLPTENIAGRATT